ncbi:MAG: BMC domain-containing protein [Chloroflexi bacterium]|nr:MAG: BMC domain-containing protein [Chloroflexota bacterium]
MAAAPKRKPTPKSTKKPTPSRSRKKAAPAKVVEQTVSAVENKAPLVIDPALALLEYHSIAAGVLAADAMVKQATLDVVHAGTVQPGRFLVLLGGVVAEVEEALKVGKASGADALNDHIFLPGVHKEVVRALAAGREVKPDDALGIFETRTVPSAIHAADKGIKGAAVTLMEVRLADGLGGKGLVFFTGLVSDVEAALEIADDALEESQKVRHVVIPQIHADIANVIRANTRFGPQLNWPEA